ncbi:MAG TPA: hypothetical protein VIV37_04725 [Gaiellaceae bacterium]
MSVSAWEAIFMLVVLKIPVIYLATVVWWAVRAEPEVAGGDEEVGVLEPQPPCGWSDWQRRRAPRPGRGSRRPRVRAPVKVRAT